MNPHLLKGIIFDAYGTLLSTGTGSVDAARDILALRGRADISPNEFYRRWKALHREHIDGLGSFQPESAVFETDLACLYREYGIDGNVREDVRIMLDTLGRRRAFPETAGVLKALAGRYLLAIGSTTDTAPLLADLRRNGLEFTHIFTSESLGAYKPRPAFYEAILDYLGMQASDVLFVGDSLTDDVYGPRKIGMHTCWVDRRGQGPGSVPGCRVSDLNGLLDILRIGA